MKEDYHEAGYHEEDYHVRSTPVSKNLRFAPRALMVSI